MSESGKSSAQTQIERALQLEELDVDLSRSYAEYLWKPPGARGVFGGQVLGQALKAATETVPSPLLVHSLHSYFLLPGDNSLPVIYQVLRTRDGRSFCTRIVQARQRGKTIFILMASFQRPEHFDLEHQYPMPECPPPELVPSEEDRLRSLRSQASLPTRVKDYIDLRLNQPIPIEIKLINAERILSTDAQEPRQYAWMRATGKLSDAATFHQCVAAYASDHMILTTALLPHGMASYTGKMKLKHMATLDHSMWFHAPFRADEWMLFQMESPRTGANRGLVLGRLYTRDGKLVVSIAQEGVIRTKPSDDPLAASKL